MSSTWRCFSNLLALGLFLAGCAGSPSSHQPTSGVAGTPTPDPPAFLTGAAALLLTQLDGFSAHLILTTGTLSPASPATSGELQSRAGKLTFTPTPMHAKSAREGFSFIWDVAQGRGYVLSEALQGSAPVTARATPTNSVSLPGSTTPELIDGHPCQQEQVTVAISDGSSRAFRVSRATDLKQLAIRISSLSNSAPFTLSLSKVRLMAPPAEVFSPPDSFTKYASADAMLTELIMRQHELKRPPVPVTAEPINQPRPRY